MQVVQAIPYRSYRPVDRLKERTVILQEFRGQKIIAEDMGELIVITKEGAYGQEII